MVKRSARECLRDVITAVGGATPIFRGKTGNQLVLFWLTSVFIYVKRLGITGFSSFLYAILVTFTSLAMPKETTEVSCCVKYLLFFFNVFFWVSLRDKYTHNMVIC